jgi:Mn-dependent DtxR family transcriptional regulator
LGEELGLAKAAPLDTPKNALRRLQKDELVVKLEYGHYEIQDEGFVEWLRQLELEE